MKKELMTCKSSFLKASAFFLAVFCLFLAAPQRLYPATITNEGETTVKVNGRSTQGITGGWSLPPGQSRTLKSEIAWIEHVPEGGASQVRIKILENDGRMGRIDVPGGRYTFQSVAGIPPVVEKKEMPRPSMASGYAENNGTLAMMLSLIDKNNHQRYALLLPGQKTELPKDTIEVISDRHGWSSGDVQISLLITMPDGKEHTVRTSHAVVRANS